MRFSMAALVSTFCGLLLVSCSVTTNPTNPLVGTDPTVPTVTTPCLATIVEVSPADGTESVPVSAGVVVEFSEEVTLEQISVEVVGVEGEAVLTSDRKAALWNSPEPFTTETEYTIEARACESASSTTFTTVGEPVPPVEVESRTYGIPWGSLSFTQPPAGGSLLADAVEIDDVLFQFVSFDEVSELANVAAGASVDDPVSGDPVPFCDELIRQNGVDFSENPSFAFGPSDVAVPAVIDSTTGQVLQTIVIEDLELTFEVSSDSTRLLNPALTGLVPVEPLLGDGCQESALVLLVEGSCEPCSVANSGSCLRVSASASQAGEIAGFDLVDTCTP